MSLEEYFGWQAFDDWRADVAEQERADRDAMEAGEPTSDMREEAMREARRRGLELEERNGDHR
jgi:hypothetical protein